MALVPSWTLPVAILLAAASCGSSETTCTTGSLCTDARADRATPATDGPAHDRTLALDWLRDRPTVAPEVSAPYQHEDITPATLQQWIASKKAMTVIDVREPSEYATGHIAGALNLAWTSGVLKQSLSQIAAGKPVVVYCASGNRSDAASTWLVGQGFKPVHDMLGGIAAWKAAGYPTEK